MSHARRLRRVGSTASTRLSFHGLLFWVYAACVRGGRGDPGPPGGVGAGFGVIERAGSLRGRRLGRECIRSHPAGDPPERLRASHAARAPPTARPRRCFFNMGRAEAGWGESETRMARGWASAGRAAVSVAKPRALSIARSDPRTRRPSPRPAPNPPASPRAAPQILPFNPSRGSRRGKRWARVAT